MVEKISMETLEYYENGHSESDTFHTSSNTENFKKVTFMMKVLP